MDYPRNIGMIYRIPSIILPMGLGFCDGLLALLGADELSHDGVQLDHI
jgi:hypothetical protein